MTQKLNSNRWPARVMLAASVLVLAGCVVTPRDRRAGVYVPAQKPYPVVVEAGRDRPRDHDRYEYERQRERERIAQERERERARYEYEKERQRQAMEQARDRERQEREYYKAQERERREQEKYRRKEEKAQRKEMQLDDLNRRKQMHAESRGRDHDRDDRRGEPRYQPEHPRAEVRVGGYFEERQRREARDYYRGRHCPPGLAKRSNGCLPPGQARRWGMGQPLPRDVVYVPVEPEVRVHLGVPPPGHEFVRVATDILLIAVGTSLVVDAIEDLGR